MGRIGSPAVYAKATARGIACSIFCAVLLVLWGGAIRAESNTALPILQWSDGEQDWALRVADTPASRQLGLGGSAPLERGEGMLFVFERPGVYGFWMRGVDYPIDIYWLSAQGAVQHHWRALPCTMPCPIEQPPVEAAYVLEVAVDAATWQVGEVLPAFW